MDDTLRRIDLEAALTTFFQSPQPDPGFLEQLATRLTAQRAQQRTLPPPPRGLSWSWARVIALTAAIALVITFLALGPEKVIAQIEEWLGYVPGLGVVEMNGARALDSPVSYSRDGVTFTVVQFIASTDETLLVVEVSGLGQGEQVSPRTVFVEWPGGSGLRTRADMSGPRYPPCGTGGCPEVMQPNGFVIRKALDPLPGDVYHVKVVWMPHGMVAGAAAGEEWKLDLSLQAWDKVRSTPWIVNSYVPENAEASHQGIGVRVTRVFQDAQSTLLELEVGTPLEAELPSMRGVSLRPDVGGAHQPDIPGETDLDWNGAPLITSTPSFPNGPLQTIWPERLRFAGVERTSRQLTLEIASIRAMYPDDAGFSVDVGGNPKAGDVLPLDVRFDAGGFPVHIVQARIVEASVIEPSEQGTRALALEFSVDPLVHQHGRKLVEVWLNPLPDQHHAEPFLDSRTGVLTERLAWDTIQGFPHVVQVRIAAVILEIGGPWTISWPIPH